MKQFLTLGLAAVASMVMAQDSMMQDAPTFTLTIENISTEATLATSSGSVPVPLAPGVWVLHKEEAPLFASGEADRGQGLEALAEDGNPAELATYLESMMADDMSDSSMSEETSDHSTDDDMMMASHTSGVFNTPVGADAPGPLLPGGVYETMFSAVPGQNLSFATMFVQSNDWFYAPDESGIALFDAGGNPVSGDISEQVLLWDGGTEADEEPGTGANQAPRQAGPNIGDTQADGVVAHLMNEAGELQVVKVTLTPLQ